MLPRKKALQGGRRPSRKVDEQLANLTLVSSLLRMVLRLKIRGAIGKRT